MIKNSGNYIFLLLILVIVTLFCAERYFIDKFKFPVNYPVEKEIKVDTSYQSEVDSVVRIISSVEVNSGGLVTSALTSKNSTHLKKKKSKPNTPVEVDYLIANFRNNEIALDFDILKKQNGVEVPQLRYKILKPTVTKTINKTITIHRNSWVVGVRSTIADDRLSFSPTAMFQTRKWAYSVAHNLYGSKYNIELGVYYRI